MRLVFILLLGGVSAWQLPQWALRPLAPRESNIPQFILDAGHPWIQENVLWLNGYPDIANVLCALNSTVIRKSTIPVDLFRRIEVDNNRAGINRRIGWGNAQARLEEIRQCPAALHHVEDLYVDIFVYRTEPFEPPEELLTLFAEVLLSMHKLRTLDWRMPCEQTQSFERAFVNKNLSLPSVRQLTVAAFSDYLVPMCPNLETLETAPYWPCEMRYQAPGPFELLVKSTTGAKNITKFIASSGSSRGWSTGLLQGPTYWNPNDLPAGGRTALLKSYLEVLARFPNLLHLDLPRPYKLGLGFDGGAGCGNAYFGPGGGAYWRQVSQESAETIDVASRLTLEILPHLKGLNVGGGESANITIVDGRPVATWPWTGRMVEWIFEEYALNGPDGL